jgi:hypothetical protein
MDSLSPLLECMYRISLLAATPIGPSQDGAYETLRLEPHAALPHRA